LNEREAEARREEEAELAEFAPEPPAVAPAAARLESLPSLEALDAELGERTAHIERLSATLLAERERHLTTTVEPPDAVDEGSDAPAPPPGA
jgi:hypothetical protein